MTFTQQDFTAPVNDVVTGLPEGLTLRVVSDNKGDRIRNLTFLLTCRGETADKTFSANAAGEVGFMFSPVGTLRVRILAWHDYDPEQATASRSSVQFDFMLPKENHTPTVEGS